MIYRNENIMNSEFDILAEKIERLVALTNALRLENVELRRSLSELLADNKTLRENMQEAHTRVEAVLKQLPQENVEQLA